MSNHEYGALEKTWQFMETKFKIKIKIAKVSLPIISEEKFIKNFVTKFSSKTKILFLSHITSPTALLFPIKKLIKIAREKNIITIIDGAHAPGHIDLNLKNLNADFYSGNCHKWMMSPKGSAFIWSSSKFKNHLDPLIVSHGWNKKNKSITNMYVNNLKYGTVAINEWSAIGFIIPTLPWGGFPGNKDNDIQSGKDFVHNSLFFESVENGIVYSRFRMSNLIDPLWFVTNKKGKKVFKNLTYFQIDKSIINFIKLGLSAVI